MIILSETVSPVKPNPKKRDLILKKLADRNLNNLHLDRNAFLNSIKNGVSLRKTKSNNCSNVDLTNYIDNNDSNNNNNETHNRSESPESIWSLDSHEFVYKIKKIILF